MTTQQISCDVCHIGISGPAWGYYITPANVLMFRAAADLDDPDFSDACGPECCAKALSQWMTSQQRRRQA